MKLMVYDINPAPIRELEALGAKKAQSCREAAGFGEVIITMLPNSPHVKQAVLGGDGVLEGAAKGCILVDMSSIAPLAAQEIAKAAAEKGVIMLDAPVSGGEPKAIDGSLAIMVGGPEDAFDKVKGVFEVLGGFPQPWLAGWGRATPPNWPTRSSWR